MNIPAVIYERIESYSRKLAGNPKLRSLYRNCFLSTWETALEKCDDGTYFVLTGDIPAMWLRDSAAQVTHYIPLADDAEVAEVIEGVLRRQFMYIEIDPYANAFNKEANGRGHVGDIPQPGPWVWERKYEVDSLCYPIRLLYLYWKKTGRETVIKEWLEKTAVIITEQWQVEQHHFEKSPYRFTRPNARNPWSTIYNNGMGSPVVYTGMTWSGFRPSDDGCQYGYLTASEMFAVVALRYMEEMLGVVCKNQELADRCGRLADQIDAGIKKYTVVEHPVYGRIYACETDGSGNYSMIDDANIPSLLSIPYIGYADASDEVYQNTRRFLLSKENPYYFEGEYAKGIGSRHTPENYVWHMALVMQGLTSVDPQEKRNLMDMIAATDADTGYLHEGFDVNDPRKYTREWFTWPCALFCEFAEQCADEGIFLDD